MGDAGWGIIFVLGITALIVIIIAIVAWQIFKTKQTQISSQHQIAQEENYRKLAEQTAGLQEQISADLLGIRTELSDMRQRVSELERMLKEVG